MISPVKMNVEVKTTIPETSSGRLVDALTDVIRPVTESFGWIGDHIRLHRAETALKVATLGMKYIKKHKIHAQEIPIKGLVPLLEKSSLEEVNDDYMINMWAKLLASGADGHHDHLARYSTILSELTGKTARLLEHIIVRHHDLSNEYAEEHALGGKDHNGSWVIAELKRKKRRSNNPMTMIKSVLSLLDFTGIAIDNIHVNNIGDEDFYSWPEVSGSLSHRKRVPFDDNCLELSILESLGLIENQTFQNANIPPFQVSAFYYTVTAIGFDLYACCNPEKLRRFYYNRE